MEHYRDQRGWGVLMSDQKIDVADLRAYWDYLGTIEEGFEIKQHVLTTKMPPWNDICIELSWRWYGVNDGFFRRKHHGYCGVYRLVGLEADGAFSKPAAISRLGGQDRSGTLYIGESGMLNERLNQLRAALLRGGDTHGAGRMWRDSTLLVSRFPTSRLAIAMLATDPRFGEWIEKDLIRAYLNSFGDSPPLNCSF
jgi:hypothetical protein